MRQQAIAALFIAAPCFVLASARRLQRDDRNALAERPNAAFAAAVLMSVPYAHHAYSRADFVHVVVSVLPLMVAAWTFPPRRWAGANRLALTAIAVGCFLFLLLKHPGFVALRGAPLERVVVQGDTLRGRSPTWEIHALFPASAPRQWREIERLETANVALALIHEWQMDGRVDLGFERTHPLIAAHIRRCLRELDAVANPLPRLRAHVADARRCAAR